MFEIQRLFCFKTFFTNFFLLYLKMFCLQNILFPLSVFKRFCILLKKKLYLFIKLFVVENVLFAIDLSFLTILHVKMCSFLFCFCKIIYMLL